MLDLSAHGTYHRTFEACIPERLNQAGVPADVVRLETAGIAGNSRLMMLARNSGGIATLIRG